MLITSGKLQQLVFEILKLFGHLECTIVAIAWNPFILTLFSD